MLQDKSVPISIEFWAGFGRSYDGSVPEEFVDQEFVEAWTMAFRILANILINIEVREYQDKPWYGFKAFRVTRLQPECRY